MKATLKKALAKGAATVKLTSKIGAKKLPPGTYVVTVTATNAVGTSAAARYGSRSWPEVGAFGLAG